MTYAKSEYTDFLFNFVLPIAGFSEMKGNSNARFPEWSGSLYSGYEAPVANSDWNWFVNGDLSYVGKTFVDESNLAYCKAYTLGNLRAGGNKDGLRIEGFIKNVFDDDSWTACARWTDFDSAPSIAQLTTFQGVAVTQQTPASVWYSREHQVLSGTRGCHATYLGASRHRGWRLFYFWRWCSLRAGPASSLRWPC